MLYINMIKESINKGKQEVSKIYCCGSSKGFKIGQTGQKYISQRIQTLRKTEKDIALYAYVEFVGSKALRDFVESSLRLYMQGKGYQLQGNDHFVRKGKASTFKRHYMDIVTNTLNALEIDYTVINK